MTFRKIQALRAMFIRQRSGADRPEISFRNCVVVLDPMNGRIDRTTEQAPRRFMARVSQHYRTRGASVSLEMGKTHSGLIHAFSQHLVKR